MPRAKSQPHAGNKKFPLPLVFLAGFVSALMCIYIYLGFVAHTNPTHGAHPTMPSHMLSSARGVDEGHPTLPLLHRPRTTKVPPAGVEPKMVHETPPKPKPANFELPGASVAGAPPPLPPMPPPPPDEPMLTVEQEMLEAAAALLSSKDHGGVGDVAGGTVGTVDAIAAMMDQARAAQKKTLAKTVPPRPAAPESTAASNLESQPGPGVGPWEGGAAKQSHGSEPKVALIVPIRDAANALSQGVGRWKNADELVEHMCTFLPKANAPLFDVIFIEQSNDGNPFNKGVLFNAGYKLTVTKGYSHMVLHDVDQIPENTKNSYGHPGETAVHLLTATSQWDYTPMHKDTVGGALSLSHAVYAAVGGYSNLFWGWGGEDNNMYTRLNSGPGVRRPKLRVGRYKALFHPRVMGLDETEQFKKNHKIIHTLSHEAASDGIATVKYKELQARHRPACSSGGGGSSGGGNSVVIHTIEVLNTENLHPDAAGSPAADSPPPPPPAAAPPPPAGSKFRLDGRCGPSYPAPGAPSFGECDPYSDADQKGPCCNPTSGWCGNERGASWGHCPPRCTDCVDFSSSKPNDQPLSDPPSPPQDNGAASAANGDEAIYEIADGYDCEGNDLKQHVCETDVSRDECIAAMHVLCLDTPKCVGFNFPGGWLKEACPTLMRFPDSTIYIHQDILAKRRAEMPSEEDRAADVFQKLSALHGAPPVEMSVACPLRVVPSKITVSTGGESIAAVYQRAEEDEYPKHRKGAFVAGCTVTDSSNRARKPVDAFSNVLNGMQVVGPGNVVPGGGECTSVLGNDMPGVLMQRYEYANLYHTMCDWASLYETMHTHGLERDKFQIVWLDGHAAGALDLPWGLIFTKHITFVKHLTNEPCYNPAYFTADGSKSDLYNGCQRGAAKGAGFATFALEQLGLLNASVKRTIVVIDRKPYVSHPRLQTPLPAVTSRSWENVNEIMLKLKAAFPLDEVKLVDLASHTFVEQVEIIRSAWGVVGMHGAAMAFMLFMSPNSVLVEVSVKSPKMFNNFAFCAPWVHHTRIELGSGSSRDHAKSKAYYVQPATIITALQRWGPPS